MNGSAQVVAGAVAAVAPHAQVAVGADDAVAEQVVGPLRRLGVAAWGAPGALVVGGLDLHLVVFVAADDRGVGGLLRLGPLLGRYVAPAAGLAGEAVPDLIAGVVGVKQQVPDGRAAPS